MFRKTGTYWGLLLGVMVLGNVSPAIAEVSISATTIQGSSSLQFGRQDVLDGRQKEVRIRLTSSDGNQYQVFQRMIDPLTSPQGGMQNRDALQFYSVSGSNSSGALYAQMPEYLGRSEQLIYTSSENGSSDRFVLAYIVDRNRITKSGQYYGRIMFSVRPISGGGSEQNIYLDVILDAELDFNFELRGERGRDQIELSNERGSAPAYRVDLSYDGNVGELKVYQELLRVPTNNSNGKEIPLRSLTFDSQCNVSSELPYNNTAAMERKRMLIYSANTADDQCVLRYGVDPSFFSSLEAGEYLGQLRYTVSGPQGEKEYVFDLAVYIKPEFEIELGFPEGPMRFNNLFAGGPPQTFSVEVRVNSNIGRPYSVTQELTTPLANERGQRLDPQYFLVSAELLDESTGVVLAPEFEPVKERGEVLFTSDKAGSPAKFRVFYQVRPYAEMEPGDYYTEVRYSLGEM